MSAGDYRELARQIHVVTEGTVCTLARADCTTGAIIAAMLEDDIDSRHATWIAHVLAQAQRDAQDAERLREENDNLRAALSPPSAPAASGAPPSAEKIENALRGVPMFCGRESEHPGRDHIDRCYLDEWAPDYYAMTQAVLRLFSPKASAPEGPAAGTTEEE